MFHISFILVLFLCQLSIGCIISLALMPLKEVDRKFYQLSSGLSSILMAMALGLALYYPFELPESFGVVMASRHFWLLTSKILFFIYLAVTTFLYFRLRWQKLAFAKPLVRLAAGFGVLALVAEGMLFRPASLETGLKSGLLSLDIVTAAMFLGIFMLAMVFGHWYLVQAMPKRLLRRMAEILFVVLVVRILVVGSVSWYYANYVDGGAAAMATMMDITQGHGLFYWQRMLIGLGIPLILSYMIWSTAKMGANQSATGLLYVGVVFVIIGEMISKYLFMMSGIPI